MKKDFSLLSCFIYSKEYSIANGHNIAIIPANKLPIPSTCKVILRFPVKRKTVSDSVGFANSIAQTSKEFTVTAASIKIRKARLVLKESKGINTPMIKGISTTINIIISFIAFPPYPKTDAAISPKY